MARVIRGDARLQKRAVVDAEAQAATLLHEAARDAAAQVAAAVAEAEALREQARARGHDAGLAMAGARLIEAGHAHEAALAEAQAQVAKLGAAIARQLLHAELELAPERIRGIVAAVLEKNRRAARVSVRVAVEARNELLDLGAGIEVITDPSLGPGDCVVESDLGRFDARIEVRLDALDKALREATR